MKLTIIVGITLVCFSMVSYVTAIPYTESQPLIQKIKINENIKNSINYILQADGLLSVIIGILLLIPSLILLTSGLVFFSMPMPMKIGGAVFAIIGLIASIISFLIISVGLNI
jgi:hypothetical protein